MSPGTSDDVLRQLEEDGLLRREGARYRTTRRWQSAMARAACRLLFAGDGGDCGDLRVPIAAALLDLRGDALTNEELARQIEALVPIEAAELDPRVYLDAPATP